MNREEFIQYVRDNFNVSVEFLRLLRNILDYAASKYFDEFELRDYMNYLLDGTIGLSDEEIKKINLY